jgi:hypothetical protein
MTESLSPICHIMPIVKAIGYARQPLIANGHTILSRKQPTLCQRTFLIQCIQKQHFRAGSAWGAITPGEPCVDTEDDRERKRRKRH